MAPADAAICQEYITAKLQIIPRGNHLYIGKHQTDDFSGSTVNNGRDPAVGCTDDTSSLRYIEIENRLRVVSTGSNALAA